MRSHIAGFAILLLCLGTIGSAQTTSSLIEAVKRGDREAVRELLRGKPDVNVAQADGTTALHWAVRANDAETVKALLKAGANANAANAYGMTPLFLAATNSTPVNLNANPSTSVDFALDVVNGGGSSDNFTLSSAILTIILAIPTVESVILFVAIFSPFCEVIFSIATTTLV